MTTGFGDKGAMSLRHATLMLAAATLCAVAAMAGMLARGAESSPPPHAARQTYDPRLAAAYVEAQCWQCHTVSTLSAELARDFGPAAAGARAAGPDLAGIGGLYSDGWHAAHLFNPQSVMAGSQMPAQRQLFVLDGMATTPNTRGERRPALKFSTQLVIGFMQSLTQEARFRALWPSGHKELPLSGSVREGRELYQRHCIGCHGQAADGRGEAALFFTKLPANLAASRLIWRSVRVPLASYDDIYATITNGLPGSGMPAFTALSDEQRASLVAYIASLNREVFDAYEPRFEDSVYESPPVLDAALIARGKELFSSEQYKCASCHGAQGRGDGEQRADLLRRYGVIVRDLGAERLRRGGAQGVFASIALGLGEAMPGQLKDDGSNKADIWALAAYARSLNRFER
jgi:mono/diheme cytochrome c family protein